MAEYRTAQALPFDPEVVAAARLFLQTSAPAWFCATCVAKELERPRVLLEPMLRPSAREPWAFARMVCTGCRRPGFCVRHVADAAPVRAPRPGTLSTSPAAATTPAAKKAEGGSAA